MKQPIDRTLRPSFNKYLCEYLGLKTEERREQRFEKSISLIRASA